jgi:hypothetical protein
VIARAIVTGDRDSRHELDPGSAVVILAVLAVCIDGQSGRLRTASLVQIHLSAVSWLHLTTSRESERRCRRPSRPSTPRPIDPERDHWCRAARGVHLAERARAVRVGRPGRRSHPSAPDLPGSYTGVRSRRSPGARGGSGTAACSSGERADTVRIRQAAGVAARRPGRRVACVVTSPPDGLRIMAQA